MDTFPGDVWRLIGERVKRGDYMRLRLVSSRIRSYLDVKKAPRMPSFRRWALRGRLAAKWRVGFLCYSCFNFTLRDLKHSRTFSFGRPTSKQVHHYANFDAARAHLCLRCAQLDHAPHDMYLAAYFNRHPHHKRVEEARKHQFMQPTLVLGPAIDQEPSAEEEESETDESGV